MEDTRVAAGWSICPLFGSFVTCANSTKTFCACTGTVTTVRRLLTACDVCGPAAARLCQCDHSEEYSRGQRDRNVNARRRVHRSSSGQQLLSNESNANARCFFTPSMMRLRGHQAVTRSQQCISCSVHTSDPSPVASSAAAIVWTIEYRSE